MNAPTSAATALAPRVAGATHPGMRREDNQDTLLLRPDLGLYLVADGVGGHNAGELASALARISMMNFFEATQQDGWPDSYRSLMDLTLEPPAQRLSAALRKANADIHTVASTHKGRAKMSTTVVAAYLPEGTSRLHLAHVGDSRCYRFRDGLLEQLTADHTMRLEAQLHYPHITAERLAKFPANMLSRALGREGSVELDSRTLTVQRGDVFLLCSDGVTRMLDDEQILEVLGLTDDPEETVQLLVDFANDAGGRDNITALTLDFRD